MKLNQNCQSGRPDICARKDGITCPEDSCDIDDGIYIDRRLFPEPWLNPRHGLPPDETPVLVIVRGERRIGELRWERPSHEETFEAFRYWDDPTNDGQDWEWDDILCWTLLPETPNEEANTATQS